MNDEGENDVRQMVGLARLELRADQPDVGRALAHGQDMIHIDVNDESVIPDSRKEICCHVHVIPPPNCARRTQDLSGAWFTAAAVCDLGCTRVRLANGRRSRQPVRKSG
jgi:hypothetical protein